MIDEKLRPISISQVKIDEDEIAAAVAVLRSGSLRAGAECRAFEEEFAASVEAGHALAASSGTAALQMAYQALLRPGDEVLVPAFTFFATASMVAAVGAVPVFCDIDPATLTIDPEDAARRISPRTRAIAPVHLFGNPADVDRIVDLARAHDLRIIWDAAQAHGATWKGRGLGSFGDVACYSFYPTKNMTTGEGGMVVTDDSGLADAMNLVRDQGQSEKYVHTALGFNFRLTDFQAAIGRVQLRKLADWTERRQANAARLRSRLRGLSGLRVQAIQPGGVHAYHQFSVVLDPDVDRDRVLQALARQGIQTAIHYPIPLHRQPVFAGTDVSLPVSEETARHIFSLPVHQYLDDADMDRVADALATALPS